MRLCFYETAGKSFQNLTLCTGFSLLESFLKSSEGFSHASMVCSLLYMLLLFSKIFHFRRTSAVSGSIADRSNFMSDCKQMQVRLKNGKYINLKR